MMLMLAAALAVLASAANSRSCITRCSKGICDAVNETTQATCTGSTCHCPEGSCGGTDGVCHAGQNNTEGGQVYRLRNARWPNWYLSLNDRKVHVEQGRGAAQRSSFRWTLQTPPPMDSGSDLFLLSTEYKPNIYLTGDDRTVCYSTVDDTLVEVLNNTDTSGAEAPLEMVEPEAGPDGPLPPGVDTTGEQLDPEPAYVKVPICVLRPYAVPRALSSSGLNHPAVKIQRAKVASRHAELLMLSPAHKPGFFIFIGRYTTTATLSDGDPGAGGYWFFDPALPAEMYDTLGNFSGAPCTRNCGSVGTPDAVGVEFVDAAPQPRGLWILTIALALLFSCQVLWA